MNLSRSFAVVLGTLLLAPLAGCQKDTTAGMDATTGRAAMEEKYGKPAPTGSGAGAGPYGSGGAPRGAPPGGGGGTPYGGGAGGGGGTPYGGGAGGGGGTPYGGR